MTDRPATPAQLARLNEAIDELLEAPTILDIGLPPDTPADIVALFDQAAAAEASLHKKLASGKAQIQRQQQDADGPN